MKTLVGIGLVLAACGRSEAPTPPRPAIVATAEPAATAPASNGAKPEPRRDPPPPAKARCVFPSPPATPLPKAERAYMCPADPTGNPSLARGHVTFTDAPGSPKVEVELAKTEPSRERGLMYRTGMPEDAGMLFSWSGEEMRTFWMHNTCIPLDMLFIDKDEFIVGVLEQVPTLNDEPRAVPCPAAHVLELNAGWARAHGVKAGQHVHLENAGP